MKTLTLIALLLVSHLTQAQKNDTLIIKPSDVNTSVLITGKHQWMVYFKMGKDSSRKGFSIWNREINRLTYEGRSAISVTQLWENNDTVFHTVYTVCDAKDFSTLYQDAWTRNAGRTEFDFLKKEMKLNGKIVDGTDTATTTKKRKAAFDKALTEYNLDWHLDLEVFPILPYKNNVTFGINYYDPGFSEPKIVYYKVVGSGTTPGFDGQVVDCWLLEHVDEKQKNRELFYISKKTKEVLRLDQSFGTRFRYKVKLPIAN